MAKKETNTTSTQDSRLKALQSAMDLIEKEYGKGAIMQLGKDGIIEDIAFIPSGIIQLDFALGIGGYPRGRIVEIYGPEASGKTTLALHAIAACQKTGGNVAFIDAEHALDLKYAKALGVDTNALLVSQPDNGEQALDIAETLVRSNAIDMIIIDSVAALTPKSEIDGDITDSNVGLQARLMSKALRKITGSISKSKSIVVFINQLRANIGAMGYGPTETTTGGKALKYFASQRIEVRRIGAVKKGQDVIGHTIKVKIAKNKVASPFKEFATDIIYGKGVDRYSELIDLGVLLTFVKKAGAYFSFNDEKLGQGKDNARKFLAENPKITEQLEKIIIEKMKANELPLISEPSGDDDDNYTDEE